MSKRPQSVTVISWLFLVTGIVGTAYHATEFKAGGPFQYDVLWVCLVRLLAIVCGVFMLRGHNWARWLLVLWIAFHVILSGLHSTSKLVVHSLLMAVVTYFLFRSRASAYFLRPKAGLVRSPELDEPPAA